MRNHNILAAFSNERVLGVVEKALASENIRLAYSCKSVSELKKSINYVWDKLKTYDGIDLAKRTHQKGGGWYSAYKKGNEIISTEEMMDDRTL